MKRWMLGIALLTTIVVGSGPSASAVTYETAPPFCGGALLRDYLAPLKRMPKLRSPSTGQVGFGPSNLLLKASRRLIVGEGEIEYWLSLQKPKPSVRLNWIVTATLTRVNARGRAVEMVGRSRRHVGSVDRSDFPGARFEVGGEPATYRLIVAFRSDTGDRLGYYGFYYRAVLPTHDLRLGLNAGSYRPEQTVFARVENLGTVRVSYGAGYAIQRFEGSAWRKAPESPGRFIKPLYNVAPGMASGRCHGFWIPPTMPPGRYRMSKVVWSPESPLTAEFDVLP